MINHRDFWKTAQLKLITLRY